MRILVTGHQGYIGSVMTPYLRAEGHNVVGLDTEFFGDTMTEQRHQRLISQTLVGRAGMPDDVAADGGALLGR